MKGSIGFSFALLVAGVSVASPAAAADMSGTWQLMARFADGQAVLPVCNFEDADPDNPGSKFSGSCDGPSSGGQASALVSGQQVEIMWNAAPKNGGNGISGRLAFFGSVGRDGSVSGSATDPSGAQGTFTIKRR